MDGVSVAFSAGNLATGDVNTGLTLTAANKLRKDHQIITADAIPVDVQLLGISRDTQDVILSSHDGRSTRTRTANLHNAEVAIDWLDGPTATAWHGSRPERMRLTLGEDYDETTVLLCEAAAGRRPTSCPSWRLRHLREDRERDRGGRPERQVYQVARRSRDTRREIRRRLRDRRGTTNLFTRSSSKSGPPT